MSTLSQQILFQTHVKHMFLSSRCSTSRGELYWLFSPWIEKHAHFQAFLGGLAPIVLFWNEVSLPGIVICFLFQVAIYLTG